MSQLKVDTITDSAGTGAPSFPSGAQIFVPSDSSADADTFLTTSSSRLQSLASCTGIRTYKLPSTGIKAGDRWTFVNNAPAANSVYMLITAADDSVVGVCHTGGNVTEIMALTNDPGTQSSWLVLKMTEYAYSTSNVVTAGGTADHTFTAYGPLGIAVNSINSTTTSSNSFTGYMVRFLRACSYSDLIIPEYRVPGAATFVTVMDRLPHVNASGATYGIHSIPQSTATDVQLRFGNAGAFPNSTYSSAGAAWSSFTSWNWRIRKITIR